MKKIVVVFAMFGFFALGSCGQTTQKDNATQSTDTMVITHDKTDSATKSVSTDTTKR